MTPIRYALCEPVPDKIGHKVSMCVWNRGEKLPEGWIPVECPIDKYENIVGGYWTGKEFILPDALEAME